MSNVPSMITVSVKENDDVYSILYESSILIRMNRKQLFKNPPFHPPVSSDIQSQQSSAYNDTKACCCYC